MGSDAGMMGLEIGLYDSELNKLSIRIDSALDYVKMVLECSKIILQYYDRAYIRSKSGRSRKYTGQLVINQESRAHSRVFIYHQDHKYVSFHFPFWICKKLVSVDNPISGYNVTLSCKSGIVDGSKLAGLEQIYKGMIDDKTGKHRKGRSSYPLTLHEIGDKLMEECDPMGIISRHELDLFEWILSHEAGYIRYDVDKKAAKDRIHPLYHLDVNYSVGATYKQGLYKQLSREEFENLFRKDKDKMYLHAYYPPIQELPRKSRMYKPHWSKKRGKR